MFLEKLESTKQKLQELYIKRYYTKSLTVNSIYL